MNIQNLLKKPLKTTFNTHKAVLYNNQNNRGGHFRIVLSYNNRDYELEGYNTLTGAIYCLSFGLLWNSQIIPPSDYATLQNLQEIIKQRTTTEQTLVTLKNLV